MQNKTNIILSKEDQILVDKLIELNDTEDNIYYKKNYLLTNLATAIKLIVILDTNNLHPEEEKILDKVGKNKMMELYSLAIIKVTYQK